jgi:hypothetical protein
MRTLFRHRAAMAAVLGGSCVIAVPASAQTDTTAPKVTEATVSPAPNGMRAPRYRSAPTLTLTATDDVAVAKLDCSLDGGETYLELPIGAVGHWHGADHQARQHADQVPRDRQDGYFVRDHERRTHRADGNASAFRH